MIKIAFRQLKKHKAYGLLHMLGLASGMAACLLIFEYVAHERSYDRFNRNADRVVRIQDEEYQNGKLNLPVASAMPALAPLLLKNFPEIEAACRLYKSTPALNNPRNNALFEETKAYYTDSSVFRVLDIRLTEGNAATALAGPDRLVLSVSAAKKYFGTTDPLGKTLTLRDRGKALLVLAAITAVLVAGFTIGAQVWKAARMNPVRNLNAE